MTEQPIDKRKESVQALKNANKHLTEIFNKMDNTESIISSVIDGLQRDASKVGDIRIETWFEGKHQVVSLKSVLGYYAIQLEKARI